jgi:hypothetical protein
VNLDAATFARLCALLAAPDPADLPHRGNHVTVPGDPKRRQTVFLGLLTRWAQTRYIDLDPAPYIAPAKPARLFLLRRRA